MSANTLPEAIQKSINLISPLGQFHWRGTAERPAPYPQGFHTGEAGDATFHTAVLTNALSWAHKNIADARARSVLKGAITRMLTYFNDGQVLRQGCLIRNLVSPEAYATFIPQEQNCTKGFSLKDEPCMKYILGPSMCARYDISLDAISQVITACYWVRKHIPELTPEVMLIVGMQYNYYEKTNWRILDVQDQVCRYGYHTPSLMVPMGVFTKILMEHILGKNPKRGFTGTILNQIFRTYLPGVYKTKTTRDQFNNYMATCITHALVDAGYDFRKLLKRLISETIGEFNFYSNAVSNQVFGTALLTIPADQPLRTVGYLGHIPSSIPVLPHAARSGWNYWESSAYRRGVAETTGDYGQEDIIQARYLF